ncbi:uncharacterized protein KGF55_004582 [Candida pseudojiufengensis]|uniref:uncharacterized protein n=1 Tax=Candida pseudojiufengensis TaxID=497109 RepID=UPI0022251231|nr:uncharacterized protein KGF55_004582 [Candida pseudojiufengensis]KAI5960290.1 hypothetical protein KGF55_004582 [Candida pseudojiufengensis]
MKLDYVIAALAAASISEAAPIKRGLLADLFGLSSTTTPAAAALPVTTAAPVVAATAPAPAPAPAPAATTSSTGGFWANLFNDFTSTPTTAAAPVAQPAAQVTTQAPAAPATPAASAPTTTSGGFFANLLNSWFGSGSSSAAAAPVVASTQAQPVVAQTAPAPAPAATTSASSSDDYSADDLFAFLFGGRSSQQAAAVPATSAATQVASPVVSQPQVNSQINTIVNSAVTSAIAIDSQTFQGGSPGKYTGSINTETATASNGGSSAGATAAVGSYGITYSPYSKSDQCKTAAEVAADIAKLKNYELIRLYSTDCSGIENVLASMTSNQKLYLGLWNIDPSSVQSGLAEIKSAISTSSRGWSVVHTIAVGNERVNAGAATVAQMQTAVDTARSWLKANAPNYNGYIVTVDTLVAYIANPQLCQMSDYLAVNSHPYWDGGVQPSDSGPWLLQQIAHLESVCGSSKATLITETGWPTQGDNFGSCVPSVPNQVAAIKSITQSLGSKVIMFTMYNDYWKDPGPYNVEQHWGIYGDPSV